jgi:hypothetical protein
MTVVPQGGTGPEIHPTAQLSDVVHPRARLGILTVLAEVRTATFG